MIVGCAAADAECECGMAMGNGGDTKLEVHETRKVAESVRGLGACEFFSGSEMRVTETDSVFHFSHTNHRGTANGAGQWIGARRPRPASPHGPCPPCGKHMACASRDVCMRLALRQGLMRARDAQPLLAPTWAGGRYRPSRWRWHRAPPRCEATGCTWRGAPSGTARPS